jgi:hypothetical protein
MEHQVLVSNKGEYGEAVGVPYLATVANTDGFRGYHGEADLIVSATGKHVRRAVYGQLTHLQKMDNLFPDEKFFCNEDEFVLKYRQDYNEQCNKSMKKVIQLTQEKWVIQEKQRIKEEKDTEEAYQAEVENGDISESSNPEPDTYMYAVTPTEVVGCLPYYYLDFIKALPSCDPLTFGFHVQVPHGEEKYGKTCYCPLSYKLRSWRIEENLDLTGDYIPYCDSSEFEDSPLIQHLNSGKFGFWHSIVSKYLEIVYLHYNGTKCHHKAFYGLHTRKYEEAKVAQFDS